VTVTLGPLVVDAVEPRVVERFWAAALGGPAQRALLSFRAQRRAKTVKNRVHLDAYVRGVEPLLDLGAPVLAEYLPQRVSLADVESNEFCAFLDPGLDEGTSGPGLCRLHRQRSARGARGLVGRPGRRRGPQRADGTPRWLHG
jgi:hypothetical protein